MSEFALDRIVKTESMPYRHVSTEEFDEHHHHCRKNKCSCEPKYASVDQIISALKKTERPGISFGQWEDKMRFVVSPGAWEELAKTYPSKELEAPMSQTEFYIAGVVRYKLRGQREWLTIAMDDFHRRDDFKDAIAVTFVLPGRGVLSIESDEYKQVYRPVISHIADIMRSELYDQRLRSSSDPSTLGED